LDLVATGIIFFSLCYKEIEKGHYMLERNHCMLFFLFTSLLLVYYITIPSDSYPVFILIYLSGIHFF